ncbi:MAG: hypothetical protein A3B38_01985 [Candidatus Levybacteria bacterium RIFCSPLOWO2_01_FULL_36_13]|nr:MAG: hypothetical protein A2684_03220 [Candidatus Levybacteria bacterium RIFCSPHIGHO2_01_FULL_36_15b]OGH35632.1 MAG: hypothetical protein A3B38_01985 [Candidatus Levybacteria bacterium RIFCSPLOWO2_01_FULL_36_13]
MRIGIDISQLAFENTGVANYLSSLIEELLKLDEQNKYILFYSSLRKNLKSEILNLKSNNVLIKQFRIPPTILDLLWNRLHIMPIENFIGDVDIFITSDWTEPPVKKAKKATILYDLIVYKYPEETHQETEFNPLKFIISPNIVASQKRKLEWVKKETSKILCISQSTKKDATEILGIPQERLEVIGAGI